MTADATERELFAASLRAAVEAHPDDPAALDGALVELGWPDALATDPCLAVSLLFECQGSANATSSALDAVVRTGLGLDAGDGPAVVLPALGRSDPPGRNGRTLSVHGLGTAALPGSGDALVVVTTDGDATAVTVPTGVLSPRAVAGMDPRLGLQRVEADLDAAYPTRALGPGSWPAAVGLARLAVGHELLGAADTILELARVHALDRVQFDRPIATFQAVRHRLADTFVALEGARALLDAAWDDGAPETAAMAKATAGRAARVAVRHGQQVLAGIGFTTEHPFHRHLRRVLVLDELFGSARTLTRELGDHLLGGGALPLPIPL